MSWKSGSALLMNCWLVVRENISENKRVSCLVSLIEEFEKNDCDTIAELRIYNYDWPELNEALELTGWGNNEK